MASERDITQCLTQQQPIFITSDDSAISGRASDGWIIQIGTTQIAKRKGPTYGDYPYGDNLCLFCTKGYSMARALLCLRLLQRQLEFTGEKRAQNTLICDNLGLLIQIKEEASKWNSMGGMGY
jgi:hypothetical protein